MEIDFLKDIELEETKDKDIVIKSVRFNSDEFYMLQYCKYKNKKFATFVKELIIDAIKKENEIDSNIDKDELKELIRNIVKSEFEDINNTSKDEVTVEKEEALEKKISEEDKIGLDALDNLGLNRR